MCHNVEDYPHPDIFDPDRFLTADGQINPDVRDPETFVFGFGRRCVLQIHFEVRLFVHYFSTHRLGYAPVEPSLNNLSS